MHTSICKRLLLGLLALTLGGTATQVHAQAVIFPQEQQPGSASLNEVNGTYTLRNDLFSVSFVKAEGKLTFGGCDAMNLLAGDDLFKIKLQNNDEVGSSAMTLGTVTTETLTGNAFTVRGVERFNGQQLVANYTYEGLQIVWRAVLRDGSHYLRTELEITANGQDVAMETITPMLYTVENVTGNTPPVVVGNTRGAVIANNKIFAGLETPMGLQKAGLNQDTDNFTKDGWTPDQFGWKPSESELPAGITGITYDKIAANRGYIYFKEAGSQTITFQWVSGSKKLNLKGVDLLNPLTNEVVAYDYHAGSTGTANSNNVYTLEVPATGSYLIRIFADDATEELNSSGTITYSKPTSDVEVIRDLVSSEPSTVSAKAMPLVPVALTPQNLNVGPKVYAFSSTPTVKTEESTETATPNATLAAGGSANFSWDTGNASWPTTDAVPAEITALQTSTATNRLMAKTVAISDNGLLSATITFTGGHHKLNVFGMDLVDAEGNVISGDYHHGTMGNAVSKNVYTVLAPAGTYTLRLFSADYSGDQVTENAGNMALSLSAITLSELR